MLSPMSKRALELIRSSPDPLTTADISRRLGVVEEAGSLSITSAALGALTRNGYTYVRFGRWYVAHEETRS